MFNKRYVDVRPLALILLIAFYMRRHLSQLFNYSLHCCKMPSAWKLSNVCFIFKAGDPSIPSSYRPVSL